MKNFFNTFVNNYYLSGLTILTIIILSGESIQAQCDQNCSGTNTFLGEYAGNTSGTATLNTSIGWSSGGLNSAGYGNCFFGHATGLYITGNANTCFGLGAGLSITAGSDNVCIGNGAGPTSSNDTASFRLYIDVEESDDPLIYGEFDNDFVKINGTLEVTAGLSNPSSALLKQQFTSLSPSLILSKLAELDISEWSYKRTPDVRHIGPTAEDFYQAFGLGANDKTITTLDADGVAMVAIQALNEKVKENADLFRRIDAYEEQTQELKARLLKLEKMLNAEK